MTYKFVLAIISGRYTVGASRAMALVVGLKSPHDVTVAIRGPTQLANYLYEIALGVGWALFPSGYNDNLF
jgi:hypothetical protein